MRPFRFKGFTRILGAPSAWDQNYTQKCENLAVMEGDKCLISHWKPTLWERLKLAFGAGIWLYVATGGGRGTQPPVALQAGFARKAQK
jgi:hypothetical protein